MANRALILAAGKGTRMRSSLAKVLHPVCGMPMIQWGVKAAKGAGCEVAVVVGHQREAVIGALDPDCTWVVQDPPQGTGDALRCAAAKLPAEGVLLVMPGDAPLVKAETLKALLDGHGGALCSVLTAHITGEEAKTSGYGRIIRDAQGNVRHIVEVAGACEEQLKVTEVNTGVYAFDAEWLYNEVVPNLRAHPPKNEYYLTDAIEVAAKAGSLNAVVHNDITEVTGINDKVALADATKTALKRLCNHWMMEGVTIESPDTTWIDAGVSIGPETILEPGVVLKGLTVIGEGVVVGAHSRLKDTTVAAGATIGAGTVSTGATIGERASAGPMARLRPGAVLKTGAKVGNFVEVKKSEIGVGAKVSHLSYIGDTVVGDEANIGAGTITCNYDGYNKHKTEIKKGAFIGSNTALVAPVVVGTGAMVAAGSTITEDVSDNALAFGRATQSEKLGGASAVNSANKAKKESNK